MSSLPPCDAAFGPRVDPSCRAFDFTLYFEDIFLTILPNAAFIFSLPVGLYPLFKGTNVIKSNRLVSLKAAVYVSLAIYQTVFLVFRQLKPNIETRASLASDALGLATTIGVGIFSWLHHHRSVQTSTLLEIFMGISSILDIARVRTLWLVADNYGPASILSLTLAMKISGIFLESFSKRKNLRLSDNELYMSSGPEPFIGFWIRVGFGWLFSTLRQGYHQILAVDDLPALDYRLRSDGVYSSLQTTMVKYDMAKKYSLLRACFRAYNRTFLGAVIPRLCLTGFTFAQPFLINALISYVEIDTPLSNGKAMIGAYALAYLGKAVSNSVFSYQTFRFLTQLRGGLISLIYHETAHGRNVDQGELDSTSLMGTDVQRIIVGFQSIHELWGSLIDIAIATYLLQREVYVACLVPGLLVLAFVLMTFKISARGKRYQKLWAEKVEERLAVTSSMLGDMRAIKMLGLSDKLFDIVDKLRRTEIYESRKFRILLVGEIFFSNSPTVLAPVVTFAAFVAIAAARHEHSILTAQAFTSLSLISLQTTPALSLIQAIPAVIQCLSCFDRIQEFCSRVNKNAVSENMQPQNSEEWQSSHIVSFNCQSFAWSKSGLAILDSIDVQISAGRITAVMGPTGSGKSTLLESILGETIPLYGPDRTVRSFYTAAYCSQTPWLINGTIRENIIGQSAVESVDEAWYDTVLWACGLEADVNRLKRGDHTAVGSKGSSLSGGQKQRVALARAIYSRCQFVLLDDVFSGIDAYNVSLISNRLFGEHGLLRRQKSTVILVTHAPSVVAFAQDVIVLESGRIRKAGPLESLQGTEGYLSTSKQQVDSFNDSSLDPDTTTSVNTNGDLHKVASSSFDEQTNDLNRRNGDPSVYKYFSKASGHMTVFGIFAFLALCVFCAEFSTVWVDWWSAANSNDPNNNATGMYLGVYATLGISSTLFMTAACWLLFVKVISNSSLNLHTDLLTTTVRATLQFCLETDLGSIVNRFSQDMELIGMDLCGVSINYTYSVCDLVGKGVLLAVFGKYLSVAIPFVVVIVYIVQKFYLRTSRQVRLLDIEAKAPVYQLFLETSSGANTLRAYGWQSSFQKILESRLDRSQRPVYSLYCIQRLLAFILDLVIAALAVILVSIVVMWKSSFTAGAVGISLVTIMTFNRTMVSVVKYWTTLETSIGAVARIKDFAENTPVEKNRSDCQMVVPSNWPTAGTIVYKNVVASYKPEAEPVLKGISLSIKKGEKIAICGRSGSGKTSMILSLLAMIHCHQDSSIEIDGIDIASLAPAELRSRINVVPQDPFLMPGSIRFNIDPYGSVSDEAIIRALQKLNLWNIVESSGGLDTQRPTTSWSVGEKQLLCLARAMIRKSPVLILDEATSSVDSVTESIMQNVIDTDFVEHTVIAVVHRLGYIRHFDKVAFLQAGELVEFDGPDALLTRDSAFADLYNSMSY
ncbi:P-loop containing nucleoside triphosphate hydrolase protein [Talaromyces proteolyticus]|uniref:P-loop containing nucleoside triphosphate hydrolase protein n=1 Tax=Talaromyces proteolyticus TaxID=1131652 RepID=A0AAD4KZM7_9EURO|nr:P-loop containing nucleoside triphosphate hydrolase protein [Talaromyces proteolyticus]KAH8703553.1 P-loop containing nucleoside triphosphate hydrolase protein [Talaromyces proteolyticus]